MAIYNTPALFPDEILDHTREDFLGRGLSLLGGGGGDSILVYSENGAWQSLG